MMRSVDQSGRMHAQQAEAEAQPADDGERLGPSCGPLRPAAAKSGRREGVGHDNP